jgi:hypothetical protein
MKSTTDNRQSTNIWSPLGDIGVKKIRALQQGSTRINKNEEKIVYSGVG